MAQFKKQELTLAMGHHVAQRIIGADRVLEESELAALHGMFPREAMVVAGFVSEASGGYTDVFEEAARASFRELPPLLGEAEKVDLMRVWWTMSMSDGELSAPESEVLEKAGQALGWEKEHTAQVLEMLAAESRD